MIGFHIVLCFLGAWGVITHTGLHKGKFEPWKFFYYTILSNLGITLFFVADVIGYYCPELCGSLHHFTRHPSVQFGAAMCLLITCLIYHVLLLPTLKQDRQEEDKPFRPYSLHNLLVHYWVPLLTFADWLLWAPKASLHWQHALYWIVIPMLYTGLIFLRACFAGNLGSTNSPYPYPFLDMNKRGSARVFINLLSLLLVFFLGSLLCLLAGKCLFP